MAKKRSYRIVHESYLAEWLGITYPPGTWRTNVRLGDKLLGREIQGLTEEERRALMPFGASADAIVCLPRETHIVEAMVRHEPGAMEDLLKYKELLPYTTGYEKAAEKPIRLIILTPLELGWYEKFYNKYGVEVAHYSPLWIREYLASYPRKYWRGKLSGLPSA